MTDTPRTRQRPGPTQDLVNLLANGPLHRDAIKGWVDAR